MAFPITDSWSGATDGQSIATYSANWSVNRGQIEYQSTTPGTMQPDAGADGDAYRTDISDTADAWAAGVWQIGGSTSNYAWVSVRLSTSATPNGYCLYVQGTNAQLARMDSGSFTDLGSAGTIADGDTFRIEAQGTTIRGLINGVQFASVTDSTHTTGRVGIGGYGFRSSVDSGISSFSADAIGGAPATGYMTLMRGMWG